jgi:hypothetical protein
MHSRHVFPFVLAKNSLRTSSPGTEHAVLPAIVALLLHHCLQQKVLKLDSRRAMWTVSKGR